MARTGRPRSGPDLVVTEAQRRELVRGARAATSTQAYALRCRIVLACAEPGAFNTHVAARVGVSAMTVRKWRGRFIEYGLAGLADEPRPGRPPSILLDQVQQVVELTLERFRPMPRTGRGRRWLSGPDCRSRRSGGFGGGSS